MFKKNKIKAIELHTFDGGVARADDLHLQSHGLQHRSGRLGAERDILNEKCALTGHNLKA